MNPDFYANEYRRYQTFVRDYKAGEHIEKICCGANVDDYEWTKEVMDTCFKHSLPFQHGFMDGLSLHYYVHPEGWEIKGSATQFDESVWYKTLKKALYMDELIRRHGTIMDEYDPERTIGMIVDEWGTWYTCEPGTNPGFLYQQNTMRDALVAGITLNIFNKHSDRVKMANLAQMVNVLQAVLLTEGNKMIKTPTYHVFHMYRYHHDAMLVDSFVETENIGTEEEYRVPNLTESVSVDEDGILHITMTNLSASEEYEVDVTILNQKINKVQGEILTDKMQAMNTFEDANHVCEKAFTDIQITDTGLKFTIPACSVLHIAVK